MSYHFFFSAQGEPGAAGAAGEPGFPGSTVNSQFYEY